MIVRIASVSRQAVKGVVYVDFGKNKIYALTDDGDEVMVFNNLV